MPQTIKKTLLGQIIEFNEKLEALDPIPRLKPGVKVRTSFGSEGYYLGEEDGRHLIGLLNGGGWGVSQINSEKQMNLAKSLNVVSCTRTMNNLTVIKAWS